MAAKILNTACSNGDMDRVQDLLNSDWKPSQDELDTALQKATWGGYATIAALLLSKGARITSLAFSGAAYNKDPTIFQEFLNYGWDINSTEFGDPALRLVVDDEICVRWFLEHGADPNQQNDKGMTPLATAALRPSINILELLIIHGAKLDPQALLNAISRRGNGGVPVMRYLIDQGIDINAPSRQYCSPLHYAVSVAGVDRVQILLDKGADRSIRNILGETPAEMAKSRMAQSEEAMKVYEILSK
ncbi:ankyrin repeat-containing domain protein [Talaromyces proteolyticus]|uniref:Ankyrin repeat-containing domain protein n=1 Tax=Talaromyces proteolyticus TaxID=1131652 RepID=A0AAD4KFB9_9EURO|nr:ankyrin repeat-containing domain protein [Talaromyces proteolyticus]KAH8690660.1 ankyrin repeat-containing domain protein [Talaromyces proteolyticus]